MGKSGTGKASVVRSLALLCGHKFIELPVTSVTDTTDLLGGYEHVKGTIAFLCNINDDLQVNLQRHCINLASAVLDTTVCLLFDANKNVELLSDAVIKDLQHIAEDLKRHFSPIG